MASETGKRKSRGKSERNRQSHTDVPQIRESENKRRRKEEMRVLTYWHFGKFQKGGKSGDQS